MKKVLILGVIICAAMSASDVYASGCAENWAGIGHYFVCGGKAESPYWEDIGSPPGKGRSTEYKTSTNNNCNKDTSIAGRRGGKLVGGTLFDPVKLGANTCCFYSVADDPDAPQSWESCKSGRS